MTPFWRRARPAPSVPFQSAAITRTGGRPVNEDAAGEAVLDGRALFAVADGLGGHAQGELASRVAVDACLSQFRREPAPGPDGLAGLVLAAHAAVRRSSGGDGEARTTLALLGLEARAASWAYVGDTRVYHFRHARLLARTRDHSVPEMLVRAGEIAERDIRHHPDRSRLLEALGQKDDLKVGRGGPVPLQSGDAFLLCTDGWWEDVTEDAMEAALGGSSGPREWLARMLALIEATPSRSHDNYTAIAVTVS